ncbi:MAG: hypothetical protein GX091_09910 [Peptococcaceae bacterium]|nr:hypothetical protein [Peptococcaceae bacterium]
MNNKNLLEFIRNSPSANEKRITKIDVIGEIIKNNLVDCLDNDDKIKSYQQRYNNIYKEIINLCLDDNDVSLEDLCDEIVMIEQTLLRAKISEYSFKNIRGAHDQLLFHYFDLSYQIAKNKYFGIRKSILAKYLKPVYLDYLKSVAENIKSGLSKVISETLYDLNYSLGLSLRVSTRLGMASSGYNVSF